MAKFFCPSKLSDNMSVTPEGYLFCKGVPIARTGIMEYGPGETPLEVGEDGIVYVKRESAEVFSKKTLASFEGKPVTIRHPQDFVTPNNWKELAKGSMHNVRKADEVDEDGEEVMVADVLITDSMAITLVKNGLREVSCGYEAEYEQTGAGKGKQANIVGNHLALVEQGRAGNSYAIKDHNRKGFMKELLKKALKIMSTGKTIDQALAEIEKEGKKIKKGKSKDGSGSVNEGTSGKTEVVSQMPTVDKEAYDELKKMFDAIGEKLASMAPKAKDESEEKEEPSEDEAVEEDEHDESGGEDESPEQQEKEDEQAAGFESRLQTLEAALKKLLEAKAGDEDKEESEDSEEEESEDSDEEESEDEGLEGGEEGKKTGDAALAEILVPGFEAPAKGDMYTAAIKAAMKDRRTATLITQLNGGKAPTFDGKTNMSVLFHASAEVLKARKGTGLESTKSVDAKPITFESFDHTKDEMTPEKLNEMNSRHYSGDKK